MSLDRTQPASWYAEEFKVVLGSVLESLAGERATIACTEPPEGAMLPSFAAEAAEKHGEISWWQQTFPLPGEPCVWIGAPQKTWRQLAARVLGAAGVEDDSQARETYLEILQQSLGELGRSAGRRWNRPIDCTGGEAPAPPPQGVFYVLEAGFPDATMPPLLVAVTGSPQDPPPAAETRHTDVSATPAATAPGTASKTFNLLMAVELPVSVSFGHVKLPLKDVLKLTAGSIIELNRTVDEPVEVIVNNCVVARGEVVVVEGNYGVRIHQIMTRQERLEALP